MKHFILLLLPICYLFNYPTIYSQSNFDHYILKHNRISLPFNSKGLIGDTGQWYLGGDSPTFSFNSVPIVYLSGFLLSGKSQEEFWLNGVANMSGIEDYVPGSYFHSDKDSLAYLYVLKKEDPHFGKSWQDWRNAVLLGADFFDGNADGIYNPVDLNGNGTWDLNEDRPDLIGDETIWCVYKDNISSEFRRFEEISPQGIEIQQTVFVSNSSEELQNTIFVRYKIINTGMVSDLFDSVYFSVYSDPDIGDYTDDLVGCDTLLNAGYAYNNNPDEKFGDNPPCILIDFVNGPISYIPNVTFHDVNDNKIYDAEDIPIDSAFNIKGKHLATKIYLGAKNLEMTSFTNYLGFPMSPVGTEANVIETRYNMMGMSSNGFYLDPCDWTFGKILNEDYKNIVPKFMYSGDPLYLKGWINTRETDQRMMINTGPFQLIKDKPIEITVAYIVGQGLSPIESIKVAKQYSRKVQFLFDNNMFEEDFETIEQPSEPLLFYDFVLYQNYPNPFNPTTNLKYNLKYSGLTKLKVFDVLGREVTTLVNRIQPKGVYEVQFDGSNLPSGIYFYKLTQGAFNKSRKMLILR